MCVVRVMTQTAETQSWRFLRDCGTTPAMAPPAMLLLLLAADGAESEGPRWELPAPLPSSVPEALPVRWSSRPPACDSQAAMAFWTSASAMTSESESQRESQDRLPVSVERIVRRLAASCEERTRHGEGLGARGTRGTRGTRDSAAAAEETDARRLERAARASHLDGGFVGREERQFGLALLGLGRGRGRDGGRRRARSGRQGILLPDSPFYLMQPQGRGPGLEILLRC